MKLILCNFSFRFSVAPRDLSRVQSMLQRCLFLDGRFTTDAGCSSSSLSTTTQFLPTAHH